MLSLLPIVLLAAASVPQGGIGREPVLAGLTEPLFVTQAPGDRARLFVAEQPGTVRVAVDGVLQPVPYLDLNPHVLHSAGQGLLGMAFHPDYAQSGWVFVHFIAQNGDSRIARLTRSATDPNLTDPNSLTWILGIGQPWTTHNGGMLAFGPDGYLYVGMGDGGLTGLPSQDPQSLLGKMLRLDVDSGLPYAIPPDNPFVGDPLVLDEIWSLGFRNPWRFSFDRETGDLWIGDVGADSWEEVDWEPDADPGGRNYGWRIMEGSHCHDPPTGCSSAGLTLPVAEYAHSIFPVVRCSITGGYVYRGREMATLRGRYFFADYCSHEVFSFAWDGAAVCDLRNHFPELQPPGELLRGIVSFGEDADGELYLCSHSDGEIWKLVPAGLRLRVPDLAAGASVILTAEGATPSGTLYLAYSLAGTGSWPIPGLGVVLDLEAPRLAASATCDANGTASFPAQVPAQAAGRTVWFQAAESGAVSNVVLREIL